MSYGPYLARVLDWHDADTAHLNVDLGFSQQATAYSINGHPQLSCRIYGINAPELSTDAGKTALAYAQEICPPGTIVTVLSHGWDKYGGRFDGTITLPDGSNYAQRMLDTGNAVPMAT
jgi:endonuclease YncB( thermonuclease family)